MPKMTAEIYPQYKIGRWTYGSPQVLSWGEGALLTIGNFCSIAKGVKIYLGGEHRTDWVTTYPFSEVWDVAKNIKGHPHTKGDVVIGNDVWIGADSTIMSGVKIGDGSVIGVGSVVVQDAPPYSIVFGNPAKVIRYRFDRATIASLIDLAWWNWDDERIVEFIPILLSDTINEFIGKAQK